MFNIQVQFENENNARLTSDGINFTIEAHLSTVYDPKQWVDDCGYGVCHRTGISFDELLEFLPVICENIKENIRIESETHKASSRNHSSIDSEIYCTTYKIYVGKQCVFDQNTLYHGCIYELRNRIISYIARLVYDYDLYMNFFRRQ